MMVLIGRARDLPEPLVMSLHLRHGAVEEKWPLTARKFW